MLPERSNDAMKKKLVKFQPKKAGEPNELEEKCLYSVRARNLSSVSQIRYEAEKLSYVLSKNYIPDIVVYFKNGRKLYVECKGWFRPEDRTKMLAVKKANPDKDIRFVFPRDNKLNKNTDTTYSGWCDKNGFPYFIGTEIPKKWLTE